MSTSEKGIRFALISRGKTVLCDHQIAANGNFELTCQSVLDNVSRETSKTSYECDEYVVHAYVSGNITYLCVTGTIFDRNVAFNCLFELERRLISAGLQERAQIAGPYALRSSFGSIMKDVLSEYSSSDVLDHLENKVGAVQGIMRQNINKAVHRGENLDDLTDRSELLAHSSTYFRSSATKLRKRLFWRNARLWIILCVILLCIAVGIAVIVVVVLAAKGDFNRKHQ